MPDEPFPGRGRRCLARIGIGLRSGFLTGAWEPARYRRMAILNIAIGTAYLKLALDDFAGSMPLAAAAYNAGPGRPRNWRNGPVLDAAIWAENVPFAETRDYVKKVLANAVIYSALLANPEATQAPSLKARMGRIVGPKPVAEPVNTELP